MAYDDVAYSQLLEKLRTEGFESLSCGSIDGQYAISLLMLTQSETISYNGICPTTYMKGYRKPSGT
jgi:hypothetical protein